MSTQPQPPSPTATLTPDQIAQLFAGASAGASVADDAVVPLWLTRHSQSSPQQHRVDIETDRAMAGIQQEPPRSKGYAESYWVNMPADQRQAFAEKAEKAGMWDPSDGAAALMRAWGQAVDIAASFNSARPDQKDQWVSPFEAVEKLYANTIAGMGGAVNGFTGWRTERSRQVARFNEAQLADTAKSILQRELGRDPTDAELHAYTLAANAEAAKNPQTVVTRTRDTKFDAKGRPIDSETERSIEGETFNPNKTIEDMVQGSQESDEYKAAAVYLPALMQALGSVV